MFLCNQNDNINNNDNDHNNNTNNNNNNDNDNDDDDDADNNNNNNITDNDNYNSDNNIIMTTMTIKEFPHDNDNNGVVSVFSFHTTITTPFMYEAPLTFNRDKKEPKQHAVQPCHVQTLNPR